MEVPLIILESLLLKYSLNHHRHAIPSNIIDFPLLHLTNESLPGIVPLSIKDLLHQGTQSEFLRGNQG